MTGLDLVPQPLAVVAGDDDEGPVEDALGLEGFEDGADVVVHVGDLAVVGAPGSGFAVGRRGVVGQVRVVIMDPGKESFLGVAVEPAGELGERLLGPALGVRPFQGRLGLERVVVDVEAPADAEPGVDREGRDESRRGESSGFQDLGQRPPFRREVVAVVADAVGRRVDARQDRAVRRQGQRGRAVDPGEADALAGQAVEVGCRGLRVAVAAEAVGPGRVERDQENVVFRRGARPEWPAALAAGEARAQETQGEDRRPRETPRAVRLSHGHSRLRDSGK